MIYKYIKGDIFKRKNCYYAHCISRDSALGAGIAVEFNKRYNMSKTLKEMGKEYPETLKQKCIRVDNVFNLITKDKYWEKPTYDSLREALLEMKETIEGKLYCNEYYKVIDDRLVDKNINKLVMPKIGCGLDKLSWDKVESMIKEIFEDLNIEIIICYL